MLNSINSVYAEVGDLLLRGTFLSLLFFAAMTSYDDNSMAASFYLFLFSRLVLVAIWMAIIASLFQTQQHIEGNPINLSHILKYDSMTAIFICVAAVGVLDPTLLRLLPWSPTDFAKSTGGYPNLFALRCCLYGSNLSYILQVASSLLLLRDSETALSIVVVLLSLTMMVRVLLETLLNVYKEVKNQFPTVLDNRRLQSRVISVDNPLRTGSFPLRGESLPRNDACDLRESYDLEAQKLKDRYFINECLQTMRGFVPPHIFSSSITSLQQSDGLSAYLALRLMSKKSLWLLRVHPDDIQRITAAEFFEK